MTLTHLRYLSTQVIPAMRGPHGFVAQALVRESVAARLGTTSQAVTPHIKKSGAGPAS